MKSKRDEIRGEWRALNKNNLYDIYSPNIIQVIKLRRMKWAGHVARVRERKSAYMFW
jgi:hypothetical protein